MKESFSTSEELYNIQELDRDRIARELHDSTLQNLTHLIHKLDLTQLYLDKDVNRVKMELEDSKKYVKSIIDGIRQTIFYIQPMTLNDIGLSETLYEYFSSIEKNVKMDISYEIDTIQKMSVERMMNLYRVIQECVRNAIAHSSAEKLFFSLKNNNGKITIVIEDNGIGFDLSEEKKNHYGLKIIKDRVDSLKGTIIIQSFANQGTKVEITVPEII